MTVAEREPGQLPKSMRLAPAGAPDTPLPRFVPWVILAAFVALCLLVLWVKGR